MRLRFRCESPTYYKPPVQNRIVHDLIKQHVQAVILKVVLEERKIGAKGKGKYRLSWSDDGFAVSSDYCNQLLTEQAAGD